MKEKIVSEREKIFLDEIIYETKYFIANQDWEIAIPGFYIVSPKRKVSSLIEFTDEEAVDFIKTVKTIRKAMLDVLNIKNVYFFHDDASLYGFHLWMLPNYSWMNKIIKESQGIILPIWRYAKKNMTTKKNIKKTREAAKKMREYFSKTRKK